MPEQASIVAERSAEDEVGDFLATRLRGFMAGFMERIDPGTAKTLADAAALLRRSGLLDAVPRVGDPAPDFELTDQHGRRVSLRERLQRGPVVLTFFRGGWCPFCSLSLRALDTVSRDLSRLGAEIIAVSPETAENAAQTAERNDLSFSVLTDPGSKVARQYGLVYQLSPELRRIYGRLGHELPRINGTGDWTLPIPAGFVIGRDGRIATAHADTDLASRLEPSDALEAVRQAAAQTPGDGTACRAEGGGGLVSTDA